MILSGPMKCRRALDTVAQPTQEGEASSQKPECEQGPTEYDPSRTHV
jgi:hypothetical protein